MLTRRSFLQAAATRRKRRRPNFVFLHADDHAAYVMGCDGNPLAHTPNLDRLAAEGTRFARHYCNSPVCTPSRQSFLTGLLPHAAGVTRLSTPLAEDKQTLARQLKRAGYKTAVFGKMHFNRPAEPGLHGFDTLLTEAELQKAWTASVRPRAGMPGTKKLPWLPFKDPAHVWLNAGNLPYPCVEAEMKGTFLARRAVEYLEQNRHETFALWVSFQEPHSPFDFPLEDRGRFDPSGFHVPGPGPEDAWQIPRIFRGLTAADKQGINAAYYTSVSFLDRNIGRVLEALRRLGLDEDTLVVYLPDHGYSLGQHGRFEKHCSYEPALRVPLIFRWPGRVRQDIVDDFTESVDVAPAILELLGLPPLPGAQGRNLLRHRRSYVFSEYLENEEASIRTGRWKYVFCSGRRARQDGYDIDTPTPGRWQRLYDLRRDPGEFTDTAARHPAVVTEMKRLMLGVFRETHPEREREPQRLALEEALEWYLRPRDA